MALRNRDWLIVGTRVVSCARCLSNHSHATLSVLIYVCLALKSSEKNGVEKTEASSLVRDSNASLRGYQHTNRTKYDVDNLRVSYPTVVKMLCRNLLQ